MHLSMRKFEEVIFVQQLDEFKKFNQDKLYIKLKHAMYRMKHGWRRWNEQTD